MSFRKKVIQELKEIKDLIEFRFGMIDKKLYEALNPPFARPGDYVKIKSEDKSCKYVEGIIIESEFDNMDYFYTYKIYIPKYNKIITLEHEDLMNQ